jgi:hypothetical protein
MTPEKRGAVDADECPKRYCGWRYCRCGACAVCGFHKHMAIHGPLLGQPAGSKPWGHEFTPQLSHEETGP